MTSTQRSPKSQVWDFMGRYQVRKDGVLFIDRLRVVQCPWFAVYLSRLLEPDEDRDPHDHSRSFASWVLRGGYRERVLSETGQVSGRSHGRWSWHVMPRRRAHSITAVRPGTVTLLLAGKRAETWHFWTPRGRVDWRDYG